MERQVMKQGPSTLVVSLPSKWAKKHNIKKGDTIHVEEKGKKLSFSLVPKPSEKKITLDVTGTLPMTHRIAGALYKAGYDHITLLYSQGEEAKAILEAVNSMTGHEVIKHEKKSITIQRIVLNDAESFSTVYRKCFHILIDMAKDTASALHTNDHELMRSVIVKDQTMGIFADYCRRMLLADDAPEQAQQLYHIVEQLEKIADRFKYICREYETSTSKPDTSVLTAAQKTISFLQSFEDLCYDFSLQKATEFGKERKRTQKILDEITVKHSKQDTKVLSHLTAIYSTIFDLNGPLLTMKAPSC